MNIVSLMEHCAHGHSFSESVWCFQANQNPILFFSRFHAMQNISWIIHDGAEISFDQMCALLETSFLGSSCHYWFKNVDELSDAQQKKLLVYLGRYEGPHKVGFFLESSHKFTGSSVLSIMLDDVIDESLYRTLYQWLYETSGRSILRQAQDEREKTTSSINVALSSSTAAARPELVEGSKRADLSTAKLFKVFPSLSLDTACLIMHYQHVMSNRSFEQFIEFNANRIVVPEKSLFTLSQYFFSKNMRNFLREWMAIESDYPEEFWISFWSEQLWQAYVFITHVSDRGPLEAKKLVNRLPFAFMQKDWRSYSAQELINAHNFIYSIDYGMKNGAATGGFDLFFHKFFLGQFKK